MALTILDAALRFNSNYAVRQGIPKGIVLHHAATDGAVEDIHRYHRDMNGWAGIGYHFYVRKDGTVWRGRPDTWLGAHTVGFNDWLGICAEGNFEEETMPSVQRTAIMQLIAYLRTAYGALAISCHRDHDATACPGANYPLEAILRDVAQGEAENPSPTENKVQAFQRAAIADGLALPVYGDDGIWGDETAVAAADLLQRGITGARVRLAQEWLILLGFHLGATGADGIFGGMTESAVRAFQEQNGLAVDGILGVETWKTLLGVTA